MENISFVVLNLGNIENVSKVVGEIENNYPDAEIIVATTNKLNLLNAKQFVFKVNDENKILNTIIPKVKGQNLVVVRKYDGIETIKQMTKNLKSENQIVSMKNNRNKFVSKIFNWFNKFIGFLFGYTFYSGPIGQIAFGKNALEILKQTSNCSLYTKIDSWTGIDHIFVSANKNLAVRYKTNNTKSYVKMAIFSVLIVAPIVVWNLVEFVKQSFWLKALFVFVIVLCAILLMLEILLVSTKRFIGTNTSEKLEYEE